MSKIFWLKCPACRYRFYIVDEHSGHGYLWFCPKCKHEFRELDSIEDPASNFGRD
jgi:predicted Zn finger-like uncharacterized protein